MRCPECGGRGNNSRHIGAISAEEWHTEWDAESQAAYARGEYNRECGCCLGTGNVTEGRLKQRREELADERLRMAESGER